MIGLNLETTYLIQVWVGFLQRNIMRQFKGQHVLQYWIEIMYQLLDDLQSIWGRIIYQKLRKHW